MTIALADLVFRNPEIEAIRAKKLNDLTGHVSGLAAIVADGDKGDITLTVTGTVWTIDAGVVTLAKMADIATDRLIGRDTAGTGVPEALTVGGGVEFSGSGGIQTSAFTGDATKMAGGTALALATVNSNVGTFGSATQASQVTVNAKGLVTAAANVTITPAVGSITGLGTGVGAALAVNVGSAGAFVTFNGALGTPSSGTLTNATGLPIAGLVASTSTAIGVGSIELGHASDTTITRTGAGTIAVEGNEIYRAGGTDVPVTDGGTGASTASGARTNLGLGTLATQSGTFSGTSSGTNTGDQTTSGTANEIAVSNGSTDPVVSLASTLTLTSKVVTVNDIRQAGSVVARFENTGGSVPTGTTGQGLELFGDTGGNAVLQSYNRTSSAYGPLNFVGISFSFNISGTAALTLDGTYGNFANDAAAAAGGVPVKGIYRDGSILKVRVA